MFILTFILLLIVFILESFFKKYKNVLFIEIFILSFLFFYYSNINNSILSLLISLTFLILLVLLILQISRYNNSNNDNYLFQIAHEIKNPIAVCKGYLDMIDVNNEEKVKKYIPILKSEMKRALSIMEDALDLKRLKLNKDLMDFSLLLDDVKETMNTLLKDNYTNLIIPKIDDEIIIDGDYEKLKQVLINVIKNSYEAESKNIKIVIKMYKKMLKLSIIDDGIGISDKDIKKIGDIFYTTKPMGSGLGVSISKEIIKLHNGSMIYNSELNKGTEVNIFIPVKYVF